MSPIPASLHQYQVIAEITRRMLSHAQAGQWDSAIELAPQYHSAVEVLRELGTLPRHDLEARRELLTEILENDAAIRRLASPELDRLGLLINNLQRQRSVLQAYYAPQS